MSMSRWMPVTFFRERTIQASNRLWEAISASGHKIVSSRIASAPTRQFRPITVQPRNCAPESTIALLAMRSGHSRVFTKSGFQLSRKIVRCTSRYSAREEMLNHFPSFITTPPILARSEEHTSELQSRFDLVCRLLLEKKNIINCVERLVKIAKLFAYTLRVC